MNPAEIRAEIDKLLNNGTATFSDCTRLSSAWRQVRDTTPQSYHEVIESRLRELSSIAQWPQVARLILAFDLSKEYELVAINLDTKQQCGITTTAAYSFFPDCIGLDAPLAQYYSAGLPIAVGMSAEHWAAWLEEYELDQSDASFVWLTVSQDGENNNGISALCLTDKREAIAPPEERAHLINDLTGFNATRFDQERGVVCRMTVANWAAWLELFEVAGLDEETVLLLCS